MKNVPELYPNGIESYAIAGNAVNIKSANQVLLQVQVISEDIIRFRYSSYGYFDRDFSYAIDPKFKIRSESIDVVSEPTQLIISTESLTVKVSNEGLKVSIYDKANNLINSDEKGFHWEKENETGNRIIQMTKSVQEDESFFGLGDKPTELNIRNKRFENWGTDAYGYSKNTDPLYKNIPFYYGLHHGIGYGIFFDNSFRSFFDFASERSDATSFWTHGGEMNYYFIAGPNLMDVSRRYADLTGKPDMPALWSLGFQQCKWSYYPEKVVRDVCSTMREHKVPCDAIYLDIDYMDGFRCFTWDKEKFPDPKKMVDDLRADGYKTMVIIDPGIKIDMDYDIFREGLEKDYFCRRSDGPIAEGIVWPGDCYFPDFTKPEVREWWSDLYKELINDIGIAGVWNDMNEPALFEVDSKTMPDDVRFDYDGHPASHKKAHNIYGMQMARATYDGVKKHNNNKRGLVITRSGYSGLQRYTSIWTGDNCSTWEHIWLANVQSQRMSISGVSFAGSDIGGFVGQPTGEMFVRWIQLGIFHPFCRVHSSQDDGDQEPWSFGEKPLALFREAVEMRYQMLPYHYTAFYQNHRDGTPILRPLAFVDQSDTETHYKDHEFMCGDHILTANVPGPGLSEMDIYLPDGQWYNYWSGESESGKKMISFTLAENTFPLFVKAGAVLPLYPIQQYVGELDFDTVSLSVYYVDGVCTSELYEDAHDGYQYESGDCRLSSFKIEGSQTSLTISQGIVGDFRPKYENFKMNLVGLPFVIKQVSVDGQVVTDWDQMVSIDFDTIEIVG